jgi:signal transduction histidine kinase
LLKDKEDSRAAFQELQEKQFIRYEDLPLQTKTGLRREVEFVSNIYKEDSRSVIQCNIRDITERKRVEAELAWRRHELESRVKERTVDLLLAHEQLKAQIEERQRLETEVAGAIEHEQVRLGQELHDGFGQHLAGVACMMTALGIKLKKTSPSAARQAKKLEGLISEGVQQVRNLAKGFFPVELHRRGLLSALEELTRTTERGFGVRCLLQSDRSPVVDSKGPAAIQLFRIAQEAIHNAVKHARPKRILTSLATVDDTVILAVTDDGPGFPADVTEAAGMGLRIMQYRARMIGGVFDFRGDPEGGAVVTCSVPVEKWLTSAVLPRLLPSSTVVPGQPSAGTHGRSHRTLR